MTNNTAATLTNAVDIVDAAIDATSDKPTRKPSIHAECYANGVHAKSKSGRASCRRAKRRAAAVEPCDTCSAANDAPCVDKRGRNMSKPHAKRAAAIAAASA